MKEIYDECARLAADPTNFILNQFSELSNHLGHYTVTGPALESLFEAVREREPGLRLAAFVAASGSAGTLGAGDYLGEIALLDGGPRTATATTETACRLLSLTYGMFHELLDASPSIRTAILGAVGQRLRELDDVGPV